MSQGSRSAGKWILFVVGLIATTWSLRAGNLQLIPTRPNFISPPAGGSGASDLPIASADGRYVLFASTAGNLVTNFDDRPVSGIAPHSFQLYLRDRENQTTILVSANSAGLPGNGDSFPAAVSTNGQFVLFESTASDLAAGDGNGQADVFLRDLVNQQTVLVSLNTNGLAGNGNSHNAVMTPDARFIAFASTASDLAGLDTNFISDIYVRDRLAGTTTLASVGAQSTGSPFLPSVSESPAISDDGRFVSFYSSATNLISAANVPGQVYVRDLVSSTTLWASSNALSLFLSTFGKTNVISCNQQISSDGNYVIFEACTNNSRTSLPCTIASGLVLRFHVQTGATDLICTNATTPWLAFEDISTLSITPDGRFVAFVGATNLPATGVFLWDAQSATTTLISQNPGGGVSTNDLCLYPKLDSSGRFVAFLSTATNLTTNAVSGKNCFLRDTQTGTTTLVNSDTNGMGSGVEGSTPPAISSDGQLIAFVAGDGGLIANDHNAATDVFFRDYNLGATELVSQHDPSQADASFGPSSGFSPVSASSNGLHVAFASEAGLVPGDTNKLRDIYFCDVLNATNALISANTNGIAGNGISSEPSMDASGRHMVFSSLANDLVPDDTNNSLDVFVADTLTGTITLVSRDTSNTGEGNKDSFTPTISSDGRYVLYYSLANNLTSGSFSSKNLFLRDLQNNTNHALTFSGAGTASMTPDGHRVAYIDTNKKNLLVWDTLTARRIFTNSLTTTIGIPSISPDGNRIVWFDSQFKAADLLSNSVSVINFGLSSFGQFSNDGQLFVYSVNATNTMDPNGVNDIYLYDFLTGSNTLISHAFNSLAAPNGACDSPVISADGRFIAYRSLASNSMAADFNDVPDLILYDRSNALNLAITVSTNGNRTANNRSANPIFSADGKNLIFTSWAPDLSPQDFSLVNDVFILPLPGSFITGGITNTNDVVLVAGLQMLQAPGASAVPAFTWPAQQGTLYQIQYKDDLTDPVWHDLTGNATVLGNFGTAYDVSLLPSQRFYRVILSY